MSKTKIKKPALPVIHTRDEAEGLVNEIALITINKQRLANAMNKAALAIAAHYQPQLAPLSEALEEKSAILERWASAHPEEFGKLKSITFPVGTIGFRTGPPKCKLLKKWKWDFVLSAIKKAFAKSSFEFIRIQEEVDKEEILAAHAAEEITNEALQAVGVEVVQEESFYVDPKLTEVETKTTITQTAA